MKDLTIASVEALPVSVPLRQAVTQGLGSVTKRDTVVVKVTTAGGLTGYGESYNGRAPLAVAATVNTTPRELVTGMDAAATTAVWDAFERRVRSMRTTCAPTRSPTAPPGTEATESQVGSAFLHGGGRPRPDFAYPGRPRAPLWLTGGATFAANRT